MAMLDPWKDVGDSGGFRIRENSRSVWLQWKNDGGTDNLFMSLQDADDLYEALQERTQSEKLEE